MFSRLLSRVDQRARIPDGLALYAIGDIHGCADLLADAFALIDEDIARTRPERAIHVFLGDYIDRGPDSRRTLDLLLARARRHPSAFVRGNHEAILSDVLRRDDLVSDWLRLGGSTTLMSYDVLVPRTNVDGAELRRSLAQALPRAHADFLAALRPSFTCGDFLFVHAGVRPGVPLAEQSEEDMMWIREPFLSSTEDFGKVVVHGHTPVREPDIRDHRINIDVGAYATGRLAVLVIRGHTTDIRTVGRSG
ncbi:Serine/threonine protein phosphatase I [Bradyrhizobium sp. ORS 375]|uniref:metallophosphoesterase family protein n=1 Tax=Bradyrhizobium sp. (strain ORS 375) TaxID=566679 RepID=UPI000240ACF4|nr:metallophosphoesterase family protein [Bradyrhizobium sp. ORS 375]CCD91752.1 Serine/threonine protein phosphatase I [Bradyrhizobium sp. ORS 375]